MSAVADEYEEYNYDQEKYVKGGHGGKGRSKKESEQNRHADAGGHTRKCCQNMMSSHHNQTAENLRPAPDTQKKS